MFSQVSDLLTHINVTYFQQVYDIYKSFDCNPPLEVREIFLGISKCFVRAWHDALICEIKSLGISDTLLKHIENFWSNRHQRVVVCKWSVFVLGRGFSGYILMILAVDDYQQPTKLFADDGSLFLMAHDVTQSANELNDHLEKI